MIPIKRTKRRTTKSALIAFQFRRYFDHIVTERTSFLIKSVNHNNNSPKTLRKKFNDSLLWFYQNDNSPKVVLYRLIRPHVNFAYKAGIGLIVSVNGEALDEELSMLTPDMINKIRKSNFSVTNITAMRNLIAQESFRIESEDLNQDPEFINKLFKENTGLSKEITELDQDDIITLKRAKQIELLAAVKGDDASKVNPAHRTEKPMMSWVNEIKNFMDAKRKGLLNISGLKLSDDDVKQASLLLARYKVPAEMVKITKEAIRVYVR